MCSQVVAERSDGTRPLEVLEREITALASQIHAATCRWLGLVAERDARDGWAQWGCKSCAHWVAWQCGIAPGAAREHVRVARRLAELPLIGAAFAEGELSYSKVRALTRVENVQREQDLLDLARHATASQLERLLRAYRGVVAAERAAAGGRPDRWLTLDHADDGSVLVRGRLPAEEGALVVAALEAARDRLAEQDVPAGTRAPAGERGGAVSDGRDVPAGTHAPAGECAGGESDARPSRGNASSEARRGAGGRADRRRRRLPSRGRGRGPGPGPDGRRPVSGGRPRRRRDARGGGARRPFRACRRHACRRRYGAAARVRRLDRAAARARRAAVADRSQDTRDPARAPARVESRDRGCRFPGCGSRRFLDAHHIEHWASGGRTDLENLLQLCGHHHRLLHGGYRITRAPDGRLRFHRRDGRPIPECPATPGARPATLPRPRRPDARVPIGHDRLDLQPAVQAVLAFAPVATGEPPGI